MEIEKGRRKVARCFFKCWKIFKNIKLIDKVKNRKEKGYEIFFRFLDWKG